MRLGIIGAGAVGHKHAGAAAAVGVEVARVVDHDASRAAALAERLGAGSGGDPQALWDDDAIDAVVIATPNCFHNPLAIEAMRSGKDVLVEKSMALNAVECDEMIEVVAETGRHLQVGFVHRFSAVGQGARRVVDSGALGKISHAKASLYLRRGVPGLGRWFTTRAFAGGGCLIDLGSHLLDLTSHLMGHPTPTAVLGKTHAQFGVRMRDYVYEAMWAGPPDLDGVCDVEDSAHALVTFADGSSLELNVAWALNLPDKALPPSLVGLFGDRGGVTFELNGDHLRLAHEVAGRSADTRIALPEVDPMAAQLLDFAAACESRAAGVGATPEEGRATQRLVDAIYASSAQSAAVTL